MKQDRDWVLGGDVSWVYGICGFFGVPFFFVGPCSW